MGMNIKLLVQWNGFRKWHGDKAELVIFASCTDICVTLNENAANDISTWMKRHSICDESSGNVIIVLFSNVSSYNELDPSRIIIIIMKIKYNLSCFRRKVYILGSWWTCNVLSKMPFGPRPFRGAKAHLRRPSPAEALREARSKLDLILVRSSPLHYRLPSINKVVLEDVVASCGLSLLSLSFSFFNVFSFAFLPHSLRGWSLVITVVIFCWIILFYPLFGRLAPQLVKTQNNVEIKSEQGKIDRYGTAGALLATRHSAHHWIVNPAPRSLGARI